MTDPQRSETEPANTKSPAIDLPKIHVTKEKRRYQNFAQFTLSTLMMLTAVICVLTGLLRWEFPTSLVALSMFFAIIVFAEDIWRWLPR